ncbi:MAG: serine/threonine protein kinase [Magnetococcales bacterium]|nr:serine/threonine protein kinase [Magnetococcales bacterium]
MNFPAPRSGVARFALPLAGVILLAGTALWFWLGQWWVVAATLPLLGAALAWHWHSRNPASGAEESLRQTEQPAVETSSEPPPPDDATPAHPTQIGPYRLGKMIGQGSSGTVYQCWRNNSMLALAIKLFAPQQPLGQQQLARARQQFLHGAQWAKSLHHPHLLKVLDHGEEDGQAYVVMEYMNGKTLHDYLTDNRALPLPWAILIAAKLAMTLDYLHRQQLVHADVKPANVLFDPTHGVIKLMDFSLAQNLNKPLSAHPEEGRSPATLVAGTPAYMAPEQLLGQTLDGRADLFALGVLFYQTVSGQLPFPARSMDALIWQISREPPQNLATLCPELSPCLLALLEQALQKKADDRFQSGRAFTLALTECVRGLVKRG